MRIIAGDPSKPIRLIATFNAAIDTEVEVPELDSEGNPVLDSNSNPITKTTIVKELKPNTKPKRLIIPYLVDASDSDPDGIVSVVNGVMGALKQLASERGLI